MKRFLIVVALTATATACSQQMNDRAAVSANALAIAAPVAVATTPAESNAANSAGDIPDTQAFVTYAGPGYSVLVPEGWARTQRGSRVTFTANANSESIDIGSARLGEDIRKRLGALGTITVRSGIRFGGGSGSIITFRSQSKPNPVTGKSVALDNTVYVSTRNGKRAILALSAPAGADNADQWSKIAASFRWK
jgi:hypothetical protein